MKRTQIYLTDEEHGVLERRGKVTGESMSEQIRAAIDERYLPISEMSVDHKIRVLRETAGAWKGRTEDGAAYVERIRSSGRLSKLHRL